MAGRETALAAGAVLQRWRKLAGLAQWQLGQKVGLSEWQISRWEHSSTEFLQGKQGTILLWAEVCGIDPKTSEDAQAFLLLTGNAPLFPRKAEAVKQIARCVVSTWDSVVSSPPLALGEADKRAIERQIRALRRSKPTTRFFKNASAED